MDLSARLGDALVASWFEYLGAFSCFLVLPRVCHRWARLSQRHLPRVWPRLLNLALARHGSGAAAAKDSDGRETQGTGAPDGGGGDDSAGHEMNVNDDREDEDDDEKECRAMCAKWSPVRAFRFLYTRALCRCLSPVVADALRCCYVHPVQLQIKWQRLQLGEDDGDAESEGPSDDAELNAHLATLVARARLKWSTVVLRGVGRLTGNSNSAGNTDSRGGGCGDLHLPVDEFEYTIEASKGSGGITLRQLTEVVYRLKGSKYDWWYELFSSIELVLQNSRGDVSIQATFNYGS